MTLRGFLRGAVAIVVVVVLAGCRSEKASGEHAEHDEEPVGEEHAEHEGGHESDMVVLAPETLARAGIRTAVVEERVLGGEIVTTGQVDFDQTRVAHVSPRITGRVHRVSTELGKTVSRGTVLLVIDSIELAQARSSYLQAKAREDLTKQTFEREEALHAERISSQRDVDEARAAYQEASAARLAAEEGLTLLGLGPAEVAKIRHGDPQASLLQIRSPIGGKIVEKHATVGEAVSPERNLLTVADLSRVWIWIDVHEQDLDKVHLEDEARVQVASRSSALVTGSVTYLGDHVDADSRTVRARIDVPNTQEVLRPGEFARVWLHDPHAAPTAGSGAAAVPESAVQRQGDRSLLFVMEGPGRFRAREVALGRQIGEWVEVLKGVGVGETVATEGTFILKSELSKAQMGEGHSH